METKLLVLVLVAGLMMVSACVSAQESSGLEHDASHHSDWSVRQDVVSPKTLPAAGVENHVVAMGSDDRSQPQPTDKEAILDRPTGSASEVGAMWLIILGLAMIVVGAGIRYRIKNT